MTPLLYETGAVILLSISGVALSYLLGVRQIIPLAIASIAASTSLHTLVAFGLWGLGNNSLIDEISFSVSIALIIAALWIGRRSLRELSAASGLTIALGILSAFFKYVVPIGERHHSDSAGIISNALIVIQNESDALFRLAETPKRGVALAVMLATGPDGRILSVFVPMVFLSTVLGIVWAAWHISRRFASPTSFAVAVGLVAVFSVTVPMFRASMFYINGHILLALGVMLLLAALATVRIEGRFSQASHALFIIGTITTVTARIEGITFSAVGIASLLALLRTPTLVERVRLALAIGITGGTFLWWLHSVGSPLFEEFGIPGWALGLATILATLLAPLKALDRVRLFVYPALFAGVLSLLTIEALQTGNILNPALAQIPNLVFGKGGWGTAALMSLGSLVVLGWKNQSSDYKSGVGLSILVMALVLVTKTLDGGFGRTGFGDSVNRMWLQALPIIAVTTLIGYSSLLERALSRAWKALSQSGATSDSPHAG